MYILIGSIDNVLTMQVYSPQIDLCSL